MKDPYRKTSMPGGTLIFLGGVLMVFPAYFLLDGVADSESRKTGLLVLAVSGYCLWVIGTMLIARARFSSIRAGFICGLFLLPGLIVLFRTVPTLSRQEIWQAANPDFSIRAQKRQYRDLKALK